MTEPTLDARLYVYDVPANDSGFVCLLVIEDDAGRKEIGLTREGANSHLLMVRAARDRHGD